MTFFVAVALVALLSAAVAHTFPPQHGLRVVCYSKLESEAEPALHMCTHLVYFYALLPTYDDTFQIDPPYFFNDHTAKQNAAFKEKFPHLKIIVSVNGMSLRQTELFNKYSLIAKTAENRSIFVNNALELVQEYGLDGIDIKWHFPGNRPDFVNENKNQIQLVKELREEFDKHSLIVTVTIDSYSSLESDLGVDSVGIAAQTHFLNVISYEYKGFYNNAQRHLELGVPAEKINMALFSDYFPYNVNSVEEGTKYPDIQAGQEGDMSYHQFCKDKENGGWIEHWDSNSSAPYSVNGDTVVYHENNASLHAKIKFAMEKHLGGVVYLELSSDDYLEECAASKGKFPLLRRIAATITELASPKSMTNGANYVWNSIVMCLTSYLILTLSARMQAHYLTI